MDPNLQKKFSLLTLILSLLVVTSVQSQSSRAYTNKDSLSVGELFEVSLKVQYTQDYERILFPDSSAFPDVIDLIGTRQFRITDFADSLVYNLQFFAGQDITLPPFRIGLIGVDDTSFIYTNPIQLAFKSVLPSEDAELKPLKPIFSFDGFPWAWLIVILALIAAAIWAYLTLTKKPREEAKPKPKAPAPFVSPLNELEETLQTLKQEYDLAGTRDFKYFYSTLSDSIRKYYEDLYNIPALESTTRELMRYLDAFGVDHEMIKSTRTVLNRSDMVKFAKYTPTLDNAWAVYQDAIDFLDRARLVDASRISRMKSEYEAQFRSQEEPEASDEETTKPEEA